MRHAATLVLLLAAAAAAGATTIAIDFEQPTYTPGPLAGQQGWQGLITNGTANVMPGHNGPGMPGQQAVYVTNTGGEIRLQLDLPGDLVTLGGPLVVFQYDIMNVTNMNNPELPWGQPTTFRTRLYDAEEGYAAIGNMHYDGGGGPANQAWVGLAPGGDPTGWDPDGSPAWTDSNWHTIAWTLNYETREFLSITFDGVVYPHSTWFADWNGGEAPGGIADSVDWIELRLMNDGGNDIWMLDNYVITATPEPAALLMLALGLLLRRR